MTTAMRTVFVLGLVVCVGSTLFMSLLVLPLLFINMETSETVSFHPVIAGVVVGVGSVGPVVNESFRVYGGTDVLLGYSFTPYDSLFYGVGNLIPPNVTFGIWGLFGFEMFTSDRSSIYV